MIQRKNVFDHYEVTENGDVYSMKMWRGRGKIKLKPHPNSHGYMRVVIYNQGKPKTISIHHMVAAQFLPPRPSIQHEIRHLDGNKLNNHYTNLKWGTSKENKIDRELHGTTSRGVRHSLACKRGCPKGENLWNSKLTITQVRRIRFLKGKVGRGYWARLATSLGVSRSAVSSALHQRSWRTMEEI